MAAGKKAAWNCLSGFIRQFQTPSKEIEVILSTILFQVRTAESIDEAVAALDAMCATDDTSSANDKAAVWKALKSKC